MMGVNFSFLADSFTNMLAGLGVYGRDKLMSQQYSLVPMSKTDLEAAYRGDWIARKVVDIPAHDATREWRQWQAEQDQIEELEQTEKKFSVQMKLQSALIRARLYGGAALIIGVEQGKPEEPLDLEKVKEGALKFIHVASKYELHCGRLIRDITSPWYGQPEYYQTHTEQGGTASNSTPLAAAPAVKIHPSRVVRLLGLDHPDPLATPDGGWGDPVLQTLDDTLRAAGLVVSSIASMVSESKFDIIKVPDLTANMQTDKGTQQIVKRFGQANAAKSIVNATLIDKEEEWQRVTINFAGLPDVLQMYLLIASGAADIPATRFLGRAPAGLNATGESDIRNYYDRIKSDQVMRMQPALTALDEVIVRSTLGQYDPDIFYEWGSLWQMDAQQKADLNKKKAETAKIHADTGLVPFDALAKGVQNQLIEDGTYPGLEAALEEAEAAGDMIEPPDLLGVLAGGTPAPGAAPGGGGEKPFRPTVISGGRS
jgi:phage-related protein (TIGR01555 family)